MIRQCLPGMLCCLAFLVSPAAAAAQTVQFGQATPLPQTTIAPPGAITAPSLAPGAQLSTPFDPYAGSNLAAPRFGTPAFTSPPTAQPYGTWPGGSIGTPSGATTPWTPPAATGPSSFFPNAGAGAAAPYASPGTTPYYQPSTPGVLFPNGIYGPGSAVQPYVEPFRILQHPRFSDTYLYGGDHPHDLAIHDLEFAVTGAIPEFMATTQPLYITPTFMLHLWDGPQGIDADLPGQAYSAFVDFFYASDPNQPVGLELGVAVGAFTDFQTFNQHSIRVIGEGFGVVRLTPTLTMKAGVWYLNRNDLKLLPAGGLVWQPNPQTKFDILFPNPKYTQYLTTIGSADVWWYVAGEYGGGAWTIERADGSSDDVDINDIRVKVGIDWINQRNWRGYFEVGYVFAREVVYVVNPEDSFEPRDTFLLGAGFAF